VVDDRVLVMTDTNTLLCLEAQTGKWIWNYRRDVPSGRFQVKGVSRPIVLDGKVYAGFSDGFLAMLSLKDGGVLGLKKLASKDAKFTDADTDPLVVDKNLVVGSFSSGVIALDLDGLKEKWRYKAPGPSSVALAKGILYFTTANSRVVALDAKNARPLWVFKAKKGELSRPVVAGNWLLISSREYSLLVLDRATGMLVQLFNPGKGSNSAPAIHRDRLFWVSNGEILYSMGITQ
jgi:outer membrane protein assembly factor BamB